MEDKKKQSVLWDFSDLRDDLENQYNSPERFLLEAYKGLLFLISCADADTDEDRLRESVCPVGQVLDDVYRALLKKEEKEFALEHPKINVPNK